MKELLRSARTAQKRTVKPATLNLGMASAQIAGHISECVNGAERPHLSVARTGKRGYAPLAFLRRLIIPARRVEP